MVRESTCESAAGRKAKRPRLASSGCIGQGYYFAGGRAIRRVNRLFAFILRLPMKLFFLLLGGLALSACHNDNAADETAAIKQVLEKGHVLNL